jgi:Outer membrane protein beta-barrel domain
MKKLFLAAATVMFAQCIMAQSFGLQAGTNLASMSFKSQGITISTSDKPGFLFGIVSEFASGKSVIVRPELNYIQKGGKLAIPGTSENIVRLNYLELPINLVYTSGLKSGSVFFGGGPSFAFGISGKEIAKDLQTGNEVSAQVAFDGVKSANATDGKSHYKPVDVGFNIFGGYKLNNGIFFSLGYSFGISNITSEDNLTGRNRFFYLKIGYFLSKQKK